jgi:GT2 family glycosyltransferase
LDVSILIVSFDTRELLKENLSSIFRGSGGPRGEVIVVDNHSPDGSAEMVRREFPSAKLVACDRNSGFARGVNRGLQEASGRHVLVLNADALLPAEGLDGLLAFADAAYARERAGIVGVRLLNADGSLQFSKGCFPTLSRTLADAFRPRERRKYAFGGYETPGETDWVTGACFLVRRELLDDVGPLDENFFLYYEDVDLCWRAREKGWKVFYFPGYEVRHRNPYARRAEPLEFVPVEIRRSHLYFYRKNYGSLPYGALWMMTLAWAAGGVVTTRIPFLGWDGQAGREGRIRGRVLREVLFNGRNGGEPHRPPDAG